MPTRAMSLKLWPLMIIASFIIALPQPVFTDGLNHVQVKRSETAYFKFHFYSLWPDVTTCEWHKGHCKLTVSKKYQFSPLPQIDPRNSSTVLCSLEVLNVSVDDEGKYFCTVYYKNFSMKHNLKQVELKIAGTSSNDSGIEGLDSGEFLGVVGASAVSIFIVGAILYKKASVLNLLRTCLLFCKKICQEEPSSGEDEPLCNRGTTQSSPGDENQNGDDERDGPTRHQPVPIISNGINAPPAQGGLHQGGNRNINIAHNYGSVNLTHRDGGSLCVTSSGGDVEHDESSRQSQLVPVLDSVNDGGNKCDGFSRQSQQAPVPNAVNGSGVPLDVAHLTELVVPKMATKWFEMGLQLGIDPKELKIIEKDDKNCKDACTKMFMEWLDNVQDTEKSWRKVLDALCSQSVRENALAKTLESNLYS